MTLHCVYCVHMKDPPRTATASIIRDGKSMCWEHYKEMYMYKAFSETATKEDNKK